ncbi:MAG: glycoside hydrolase family 3 N-terminal domain-containing protein [Bacteroidota bacterium]|nr:glycoside hydrolase family 3 N-terminal domain-containing protein [Bacteroidota bacterium]
MNRVSTIIFLLNTFSFLVQAQSFEQNQKKWVDSVFNTLSDDERLGQLFMVAAYSNKDTAHFRKLDSLITLYKIGGLIFFQGGPKRQAILTNRFQALAKTPLLIGIDGEWGLNMRLDSTMYFPRQMTLGAISDNTLIEQMGAFIAKDCKRMGIHVNFAPVADVNVNPDNPVIGVRSFGEKKEQVASKSRAYMKGLQKNRVMANAKHFPGHGDTDADSHHSLPVINHSKKRMDDIELYPFKQLIKDSLQSVMVAHIHIPAYDNRPKMATTLSPKVVNDLLKKQLGFKGLIFTDALNMKGVAKYYKPGEVDVLALMAGNDVLLFAEDVPTALIKIKTAIDSGLLNKGDLNERVKKILMAKYWVGLNAYKRLDTLKLLDSLNSPAAKAFRQKLYEKSVTLLHNEKKQIPYREIGTNTFASISIANSYPTSYTAMLDNYAPFHHFFINKKDSSKYDLVLDSAQAYSKVVVSLHDPNNRKKENYNIPPLALSLIRKLQAKTNVVVVYNGNVYGLSNFDFVDNLICTYEDNEVTRAIVPQVLFGAVGTEGKLPVTVSESFKYGTGIQTKPIQRLAYGYPETVSVNSANFYKLDSIIYEAIKDGSTPGAQLQIVKNNTVIYQKSFGYQTYDKSLPVNNNTIYDIASVTKTAATMQAIMFLHSWKNFNPDKFAKDYLIELQGTNKQNIILKDLMVHQAGLVSFIEHWRKTMKNGKPDPLFYSTSKKGIYTRQVAQSLYTAGFLEDSLWKWTVHSKMLDEKADTGCYSYKYSDLAFYFLKRIAEKQLNQPLDVFLQHNFFMPLGCKNMTFVPLNSFNINQIAPTEEDKTFRMSTIRGTVHDQGAAMAGGIAGHAGLFASANDLAILGQMNINGGTYAGVRYFKKSTIDEFTTPPYFNNRRALGWDRPFPPDEKSMASSTSYGHTGFTGTSWWMDPENQLVVVFLSNRTYPFADNKRLTTNSVRTKILNTVYQCMQK